MATFTESEIDNMIGPTLRSELMALGEEKKKVTKMRVPDLKTLLKTHCGISVAPATTTTNTSTRSQAATIANTANSSTAASGGMTQELKDLVQALTNCNMSKQTAEQFIKMQGLQSIGCLKVFSPDDLESLKNGHRTRKSKITSNLIRRNRMDVLHSWR